MTASTKSRIESIDLLRGIVIVIMALDHVRDYFHADNFLFDPTDLSHSNPAIFFTRWITHFCAPTFVFLAGTSAFLVGERKTKRQLSVFLLTRGLWLMLLEITIVSFAWSFSPAFIFTRLQVIWVLGFSIVILSAVIHLPIRVILIVGVLILFFHNALDNIHVTENTFKGFVWAELHERKRFVIDGYTIATSYPVLPWFGIMALGYCFGQLYQKGFDVIKRKKILLTIGGIAIGLFIILRGLNIYGDKDLWSPQNSLAMTVCSFLNTTKYPPSLLYTLMTLGVSIIFLALSERKLGWLGNRLIHFGRVPMFFYLLHLYLIHLLATVAIAISGRPWTDTIITFTPSAKDSPWLAGYGFSLLGTYLVWLFIVVMLYPICKWYDKYKQNNKDKWWLSYL
ncbi:MAG: heparan-alpha-glucosaminide N-acetyltransferase domain-containing protein [Ferruginibacter sp.]